MGLEKNKQHEAKSGKTKRGSVDNAKRLDAFRRGKKESAADWGGCDPARLQTVVVQITELGGAVIFGLSRDKGSHLLTLLLDESKETLWFNGNADLDAEMDDVAATLEALS